MPKDEYYANEQDVSDEALTQSKVNQIVTRNRDKQQMHDLARKKALSLANAAPIRKKNKELLWKEYVKAGYNWNAAIYEVQKIKSAANYPISREYCNQLIKELKEEKAITGNAEAITQDGLALLYEAREEIERAKDPKERAILKIKLAEKMLNLTGGKNALVNVNINNSKVENTTNNLVIPKSNSSDDEVSNLANKFGITVTQVKGMLTEKLEKKAPMEIDMTEQEVEAEHAE